MQIFRGSNQFIEFDRPNVLVRDWTKEDPYYKPVFFSKSFSPDENLQELIEKHKNPFGRTGIIGKGFLKHFGENIVNKTIVIAYSQSLGTKSLCLYVNSVHYSIFDGDVNEYFDPKLLTRLDFNYTDNHNDSEQNTDNAWIVTKYSCYLVNMDPYFVGCHKFKFVNSDALGSSWMKYSYEKQVFEDFMKWYKANENLNQTNQPIMQS